MAAVDGDRGRLGHLTRDTFGERWDRIQCEKENQPPPRFADNPFVYRIEFKLGRAFAETGIDAAVEP